MPYEFDEQFLATFRNETVFQNKWLVRDLNTNLLSAKLSDDLLETLDTAQLQKIRRRRAASSKYRLDPAWPRLVFQAFSEFCDDDLEGAALKQINESHLLNPLVDYFQHLYFFSLVAADMRKNKPLVVQGSSGSSIHDLDKLDPVMLAAYAERFEDGLETDLWKVCVRNHVTLNPHHPEHYVWDLDGYCAEFHVCTTKCTHCQACREFAVGEMVCDRVSRRVQKELGGKVSFLAWEIDVSWFRDLPDSWLDVAVNLIEEMKEISVSESEF